MTDHECVHFLQWALPRAGMRWRGFRKVRRQVCKRIQDRMTALAVANVESYRTYLEENAEEWTALDRACRVTISHFYRDRAVFELLQHSVLPALVERAERAGRTGILAWSAGCASGEEPYTLSIAWRLGPARNHPNSGLRILATDIDLNVLRRARRACYGQSSVKQLPESWRAEAFRTDDGQHLLEPAYRSGILFAQHDVREGLPGGLFDLVLCRYLAFTYFDDKRQSDFGTRLYSAMSDGAALVIGASETLPQDVRGFVAWRDARGIYRKESAAGGSDRSTSC